MKIYLLRMVYDYYFNNIACNRTLKRREVMSPGNTFPSLVSIVPSPLPQCGPRFELKLFQIKLGTMDQSHVENEWVLRAYTRSTKRAKLAGTDKEEDTTLKPKPKPKPAGGGRRPGAGSK